MIYKTILNECAWSKPHHQLHSKQTQYWLLSMLNLSILSVYLIQVPGKCPHSSQSPSAMKLLSLPDYLQLTCKPLLPAPFPFWLFHVFHALFLPRLLLGQFLLLLDETDGLPAQLIINILLFGKHISPVFLLYIVSHILFYCRPSVCMLS